MGVGHGLPKGFLQSCLLLLLKEERSHGYDLVPRLKALGIADDPAAVYRALRTLEEQRAVSSSWCTSATGPARRVYRLTPAGEDQLLAAVETATRTHQAIERFFCRHALARSQPPVTGDPEPTPPSALKRLVGKTHPI